MEIEGCTVYFWSWKAENMAVSIADHGTTLLLLLLVLKIAKYSQQVI